MAAEKSVPRGPAQGPYQETLERSRNATVARWNALFRCVAVEGATLSKAAKRCKLSKSAAYRVLREMEAIGRIRCLTPDAPRGSPRFYKAGPNPNAQPTVPTVPDSPGVAPRRPGRTGLLVDPHAGTVKLRSSTTPSDLTILPGYRPTKKGGPLAYYYRPTWQGNQWSVQLNPRKDGTCTAMATPPTLRTRDLETALDLGGWLDTTQKFLISWGDAYGLSFPRHRAGEQVNDKHHSMPGFGLTAGLRSEDGRTYTDPSQGEGSLETQDQQVVRSVGRLPEFEAEMRARVAATEAENADTRARLATMEREAREERQVSQRTVAVLENISATVRNHNRAIVLSLDGKETPSPAPSPSPPSPPGVESA